MEKVTKEELSQIYYLNKELRMWQKELENLECQSLLRGQQLTGMPFVSGTSDKTGDIATTMADIKSIIIGKQKEIQIQKKKIMTYIEQIEDSYMRQIIFYRCVSCMSWNSVAQEIGGNNTEDSVKQAFHRFFKKN